MRLATLLLLATLPAGAQWTIQNSHSTAGLRGIHSLGNGVAWASGTAGTVLRTTDGGTTWQTCPTPPDAAKLDFRGIQAFDAQTAIVMSSGKGDLSRLYKTTDACQTWKLVFTNPDKEGFWDAIHFEARTPDQRGHPLDFSHAYVEVLGDPVDRIFPIFRSYNGGDDWQRRVAEKKRIGNGCKVDSVNAQPGEAVFAASNSSFLNFGFSDNFFFVTGGSRSRFIYPQQWDLDFAFCHISTHSLRLPLTHGRASSGAFAVASNSTPNLKDASRINYPDRLMIVGGDYLKPDEPSRVAFLTTGRFARWKLERNTQSRTHGYRSAVAYDPDHNLWITVGPNGTDISTDDGLNWSALKPGPNDPADADRDWNALSLPFVVGPKGRIGKLRPDALPTPR